MDTFTPTDRTTVRRLADRGVYDRASVDAIFDEAPICHVGFVSDGQPRVLPTIHARRGDFLYLHGAVGNAMLRSAIDNDEVCIVATLLDGLVVARSWFHHSMNYRSVVLFGRAEKVDDADEKYAALAAIVDHVIDGRTAEARPPTDEELRKTLVVRVPLAEASAKVRTGDPIDDDADLDLDVWAGVVPLTLTAGVPRPAADLRGAPPLPSRVR